MCHVCISKLLNAYNFRKHSINANDKFISNMLKTANASTTNELPANTNLQLENVCGNVSSVMLYQEPKVNPNYELDNYSKNPEEFQICYLNKQNKSPKTKERHKKRNKNVDFVKSKGENIDKRNIATVIKDEPDDRNTESDVKNTESDVKYNEYDVKYNESDVKYDESDVKNNKSDDRWYEPNKSEKSNYYIDYQDNVKVNGGIVKLKIRVSDSFVKNCQSQECRERRMKNKTDLKVETDSKAETLSKYETDSKYQTNLKDQTNLNDYTDFKTETDTKYYMNLTNEPDLQVKTESNLKTVVKDEPESNFKTDVKDEPESNFETDGTGLNDRTDSEHKKLVKDKKHLKKKKSKDKPSNDKPYNDKKLKDKKQKKASKHDDHTHDIAYFCEFCSNKFMCKYALNRHKKMHVDPDTLKCSVCSKVFTRSADVKRHMSMHSGMLV